jgi:hypothetical protein
MREKEIMGNAKNNMRVSGVLEATGGSGGDAR